MIISRTPFRISFFGGGTDYPVWYRENGGAVLATTIDKYCYISCRYLPPFFEHKTRIAYSKIETVKSNEDIEHPAVKAVLAQMKVQEGVEIHHDGDLPARTGLGSSSAFTVGLVNSLNALNQKMVTKMQLAREAIRIEQDILKESVGCQDQVLTAYGGLCRIDFRQNDEIHVTPMAINQKRLQTLQDHLLLFFTGFSRTASQIAKEQIQRVKQCKSELREMYQMVGEAITILGGNGDLADFGLLLNNSWMLKRKLTSKISTIAIDDIYDRARRAGAIGGKLLGAGGGGFMLLFARPEDHKTIKSTLRDLLCVPFNFETGGSHILVYEPEPLIPRDYQNEVEVGEIFRPEQREMLAGRFNEVE